MTVEIRAEDDHQVEGNEKVALILTNIDGAEPAFQRRAILTIRDNDYQDDSVLSNFNSLPPWITNGAVELGIVDLAADDEMALPDQTEVEAVLSLSVGQADQPASVDRIYASPQDWSLYDGIRFWMYGTGSGAEMTFEVYDNEGSNTGDAAPGSWELVWSDEFDGPAGTPPNPAVWKAELGDGTLNGNPGWGNNELEAYTDQPENASMDGKGNLVITARKTDPAASNQVCWYGPCEYTSARLITQDTVEFAYGRVEARLKLPKGQGIWPAFWMLGDDLGEVGWPQSGEIDIMENIGREPNIVHGTVHGPGYSGGNGIGGGYEFEGKLPSDEFHVYAVEWTPNKIRWMIDDQEFFSVTPDDLPEGAAWVYDHPFFLILNLAVGGNWPGNPDASTVFPQSLLVDYVRVYGTKSSAERYLATKTDDFVGWHLVELPFNEFTRSDTQPAGAPNDGLDLDAVSGYQMHFSPGAQREYYLEDYHLFQR
jgi:beta-glucanase (GH16 family)